MNRASKLISAALEVAKTPEDYNNCTYEQLKTENRNLRQTVIVAEERYKEICKDKAALDEARRVFVDQFSFNQQILNEFSGTDQQMSRIRQEIRQVEQRLQRTTSAFASMRESVDHVRLNQKKYSESIHLLPTCHCGQSMKFDFSDVSVPSTTTRTQRSSASSQSSIRVQTEESALAASSQGPAVSTVVETRIPFLVDRATTSLEAADIPSTPNSEATDVVLASDRTFEDPPAL